MTEINEIAAMLTQDRLRRGGPLVPASLLADLVSQDAPTTTQELLDCFEARQRQLERTIQGPHLTRAPWDLNIQAVR